jgi:hypothetical protein
LAESPTVRPLVCFLTVTDGRKAPLSPEHEILQNEGISMGGKVRLMDLGVPLEHPTARERLLALIGFEPVAFLLASLNAWQRACTDRPSALWPGK